MSALLRSSPVLAAVLAPGGGVASAEEWKPYSSQDGRYSIEFPGTPQQAKQSLQTKFGPVTARLAMLQVSNGVFYAVQFQDYPKAVLEKHSSDDLLDGARESALKGLKGG